MTVATYTAEIVDLSHEKGAAKERAAMERKIVLAKLQAANLPNSYTFVETLERWHFVSPTGKRLHSKEIADLFGWYDWFDLCKYVATNHA